MGFGDFVGHLAGAAVHGLEEAGNAVGHGLKAAEQWTSDLFSGHLGTQPVPINAAVTQVLAGNSDTWHASTQGAKDLSSAHQQISQGIGRIMNNLAPAWTGTAADSAQARIKSVADVTNSAAATFTTNAQNLDDVAHSFDHAKQNLTPMPAPPEKGFFDDVSLWKTDTEAAVDQYNAQATKNQDVYNGYAATSQSNAGTLKIDYGQLGTYSGGAISLTPPPAGPPPGPGKGPEKQHIHEPGAGGSQFGPGNGPGPGAPGGPGTSPAPPGSPGGPGQQGGSPGSSGGDQTSTSSFAPPPVNTPGGVLGGPGTPTPGSAGGPGGSPGGLGGGDGFAALGGAAGGLGSGGGSGSGPGSGGNLRAGGGNLPGAGNRSGAGALSGEPTPEGTVGKIAAGRLPGNTATGMGAGGRGKGEKSEDEEHRRKYGLDDDDPFIGDGTVDPVTGMSVAPPTIGT